MNIIYVGGVKGVGKSKALDDLFNQLLSSNLSYGRVKVSEVMFELLRNMGAIKKYDELEEVSVDIKKNVRTQAFQKILTDYGRNIIFDGHYAVPSPSGYEYGIPLKIVKEINRVVLLRNTEEVVFSRRKKDTSRKREVSLGKVKLDTVSEKAFAEFYASIIGKDLKMIETNNQASSELMVFLREVTENGPADSGG